MSKRLGLIVTLLVGVWTSVFAFDEVILVPPAPTGTVVTDTAFMVVQAKPDQTLRVYPTDAYGLPVDFEAVDIRLVDGPRHGTATTHSSSFTLTPDAGYRGLDMVLCHLINQQGQVRPVTVEINYNDDISHEGSEFYFTLMPIWYGTMAYYYVDLKEADPTPYSGFRILAHYDTRVRITDEDNKNNVVDLPGGQAYEFLGHKYGERAIHVQASAPVAIEGFNYKEYNQDVTSILPNTSLGEHYVIHTPRSGIDDWPHQFLIIATRNNTKIDIHLTSESKTHSAGDSYSVMLDAGQMHLVESNTYINHKVPTFSGSSVHSNAPVAIFEGAAGTTLYAPGTTSYGAIDHVYEQALPTKFAGKEIVVVPVPSAALNYAEIVATEDNTVVQMNDSSCTMNAYEVKPIVLTRNDILHLRATKPIMCHYLLCGGQRDDYSLGDPAQTLISPLEQATQLSEFTCHRLTADPAQISLHENLRIIGVNVVVPTRAIATMLFDGQPMTGFQPVPNSDDTLSYTTQTFDSEPGIHTLSNAVAGFVAYEFGMQQTEGFAFALPTMHRVSASETEIVYDTTCSTYPYYFHGQWLNQSGVYEHQTQRGDITFTTQLNLTVQDVQTLAVRYDSVCPQDPLLIGKYKHDSTGIYYDIIENSYCDDTVEVHVYVPYHFDKHIYDTICENETYYHGTKSWVVPGLYLDTVRAASGCDSIYEFIHLAHWPTYEHWIYDTICIGQPIVWNGQTYDKSGTYTDTLSSMTGCDSIVHLEVYAFPRYEHMFEPDPDNWLDPFGIRNPSGEEGGQTPMPGPSSEEPQNWKDPFASYVLFDTIPCGQTYIWHDKPYTEPGFYRDTLYTIHGCDSVVYLYLTVGDCCQTTYSYTDTLVDYQQPFLWFGKTYSAPGLYVDTILNAEGCDSIGQLALHHFYVDTLLTCETGSVLFTTPFGTWETKDCDTLSGCFVCSEDGFCLIEGVLYVQRLGVDSVSEEITCCAGEPILWRGKTILDEGVFYDTLRNSSESHCDSIYYKLTIHRTESLVVDTLATICYGSDYEWHGQTVENATENQVLYDVLKSVGGCDSTIRLTLHVLPQPTTEMLLVDTCIENAYTWHTYRDILLTEPGIYSDTLRTENGCEEKIYYLLLSMHSCDTVLPPPTPECEKIAGEVTPLGTFCAEEGVIVVNYTYTTGAPKQYRILFSEAAKAQHFADIEQPADPFYTGVEDIEVPLPTFADTTHYVRPDIYTAELRVTDTCDNVTSYPVEFTIHYPSWIIFQRWNDVLTLSNENFNGGYTFSNIRWFTSSGEIVSTMPYPAYIYQPPHLEYNQPYWVELTREDDGKTFPSCPFYPTEQSNETTYAETVEYTFVNGVKVVALRDERGIIRAHKFIEVK